MAPEDLRDKLQHGEKLTAAMIRERCGKHISDIRALLKRCVESGLLRKSVVADVGHKFVLFERTDSPEGAVGKPYPRVLINVPAADAQIGRELWAHARLCMAVQR